MHCCCNGTIFKDGLLDCVVIGVVAAGEIKNVLNVKYTVQ